jgi:hypothetical protein
MGKESPTTTLQLQDIFAMEGFVIIMKNVALNKVARINKFPRRGLINEGNRVLFRLKKIREFSVRIKIEKQIYIFVRPLQPFIVV